ncbi:DUF423 domain-containing protein [Phenylobacterium sp.]|jgi:uncharacterized membrane protein YgdD (TMEM256/DUF423 family)|uniref:DUF423 domain-containing protein n=1 Tax=Phenylobacterium sp. TaxID=1871053 RepID=UPI002F95A5B3
MSRGWLVAAALLGLASVAFGAFGAHGVADPKAQEWLRTGAVYGFVHVLAAFAAERFGARWAQGLFVVGAAIFAGTLWAMAMGGPRVLGAVTPVGGLSLMVGWGLMAWRVARRPDP